MSECTNARLIIDVRSIIEELCVMTQFRTVTHADWMVCLQTLMRVVLAECENDVGQIGHRPGTVDTQVTEFLSDHGLDDSDVCSLVLDLNSLSDMLQTVQQFAQGNPWLRWSVSSTGYRVMIRCLGDFRIIQWELEHLDIHGNYYETLAEMYEAGQLIYEQLETDIMGMEETLNNPLVTPAQQLTLQRLLAEIKRQKAVQYGDLQDPKYDLIRSLST